LKGSRDGQNVNLRCTRARQGTGTCSGRGAGGQHVVHKRDAAGHRLAHRERRRLETQAVTPGPTDLGAAAAATQGPSELNAELA
jgi:hypothetical protein